MTARNEVRLIMPLELKRNYRSWCVANGKTMSQDISEYVTQVLKQHGKISTNTEHCQNSVLY